MSAWGIGDHHDSDEVRSLKEQLRAKDAANATLHGEYLKRAAELNEVKASLNECLEKLRQEADRVIQLDSDLKRRNEELVNERLTRQNAEVALTTAHRKLKDSEQAALELQSTVDTLSCHANSTSIGRLNLEQENAALRKRVRALERELQSKTRAEELALRQSHDQSASTRHRRRSSSESSIRIPVLEKEIADLRTTSIQHATELQKTTEQLARTRDALVQLQNEKTAVEKRLRRELEEVKATLDDREEDLRLLRDAQGGEDMAAREVELMQRLEEEEKRIATLEDALARSSGSRRRDLTMLQDELNRTTKLLEDANKKSSEAEERLMQLLREKEEVLNQRNNLEEERARLAERLREAGSKSSQLEARLGDSSLLSPTTKTPDEDTVATMEKLLNTIERLRGERDGLRRDLEFLNAENRFAVQSLEAKLAAATCAPVTPTADVVELTMLRTRAQSVEKQAQHSSRAAVALAIVAQHAVTHGEGGNDAQERLQLSQHHLQEREEAIAALEQRLSSTMEELNGRESHVSGLRTTIERLEHELFSERAAHAETSAALVDAQRQLTDTSLALTNAEATRDALALEKTHLEQDLEIARQELADADERHAEQLNALSSGQSAAGAQAALRAHIKELEARIERRTAQIGMHQHDIARLEMNLKLQEERIAEMTAEMEVVQSEKDAMLEDCRTTRDQRDEALRRCDDLEEALEAIEQARGMEVEGLVHVAFDAIASRRDALVGSSRAVAARGKDVACLQERIHAAESENEALHSQVSLLSEERERLSRALGDNVKAYEDLKQKHDGAVDECQRKSADLSSTRAQLDELAASARAVESAKVAAESQLTVLRNDLEIKEKELGTLQSQLAALRDSHVDNQSLDASVFAQEKAELETQLQDARASLADLGSRHEETIDHLKRVEEELKRAEDELSHRLSESAIRSEAEECLRGELIRTKQQYEEEAASLQNQLKALSDELAKVSRLREEVDTSRRAAEEELARTKQQLEERLAEAGESLDTASRLEAELERLRVSHEEERKALRDRLESVIADLDTATRRRNELLALQEEAVQQSEKRAEDLSEAQKKIDILEAELAALREAHAVELQDLEMRLSGATAELATLKDLQNDADAEQRQKADQLARTVEDLEHRIVTLTKEAEECRGELADEKAAHARTKELAASELREATEKLNEAEAALTHAEKELPAVRAQLEHVESSLARAEEEKLNLQYQATNLEAEVQRLKSMQRFLESQAADSERHVSMLETELADLRTKCTALDKLAKATEANLAMQTIQHEQTVASLKRELSMLRAQPRLEDEVADLKRKNAEMEELLRAKCLEIEENDDRFIEMLKEKKKLTSKVESLTRKVQNLQAKLTAANESTIPTPAAASASDPAPVLAPKLSPVATHSPVLAPAPILAGPFASSSSSRPPSRPRVVTAPAAPSPNSVHQQAPPLPAFQPRTPESRSRMASGPSALPRPKTPESRIPPMSVFKARTPERQRAPTAPAQSQSRPFPESSSSSSVVGVKRRAPDDFDDCGSLPPQPFTVDSAPDPYIPVQPTTPRLRKALQSMRTGFTPVRHHLPRAGSTSPSRRATTGSGNTAVVPPTISDVTNGLRAPSQSENTKAPTVKKGWLGKLKSAPSQQSRPPLASRPPLFDPPGMR
ncbi:hypothetical protein BD414DRAFT_577349 [Trametes punicea]|nr:hypothetical protein BD414DRAFT_577349 [Trametes punicea]